ncbi:hypothetical protein ACIBCM_29745 [Streptomyces sp. NPDC051018]|uniref:hypothetical protein n=1 Tax=Streptomyces sp. NPDC051018 TaxID=3365639 RepID=UPI003790CBA1
MRARLLATLAALPLCVFGMPSPAFGAQSPAWTVEPAPGGERPYIYAEGVPGTVLEDRLSVSNPGNRPLTVRLRPADAYHTRTGALAVRGPGESEGAGTWITPAVTSLTVPPRTRAEIPFSITIPPGAVPGDHPAALAAWVPGPDPSGADPSGPDPSGADPSGAERPGGDTAETGGDTAKGSGPAKSRPASDSPGNNSRHGNSGQGDSGEGDSAPASGSPASSASGRAAAPGGSSGESASRDGASGGSASRPSARPRESAVRIHLRVSGPTLAALTVEDVSHRDGVIRYSLVNRGNTALRPRVTITADGLFGEVLRRTPRALPPELLPAQRVTLTETWPDPPLLDSVEIEVAATAGDGTRARGSASAAFVPWPWAALAAGLAATAVAALLLRRRPPGPSASPPSSRTTPEQSGSERHVARSGA